MFLVVAMLFLSNGFFHYLVITFHVTTVSTTVRVNGTVQFTFFLGHEIEHYYCHGF